MSSTLCRAARTKSILPSLLPQYVPEDGPTGGTEDALGEQVVEPLSKGLRRVLEQGNMVMSEAMEGPYRRDGWDGGLVGVLLSAGPGCIRARPPPPSLVGVAWWSHFFLCRRSWACQPPAATSWTGLDCLLLSWLAVVVMLSVEASVAAPASSTLAPGGQAFQTRDHGMVCRPDGW